MPQKGLKRRTFLRGVAGGALGLTSLSGLLGVKAAGAKALGGKAAQRPNVLIMLADQHRADVLGCAGDAQARTPNLDRLAAEGTRFSHVVSAAPLCVPFRATLQTGRYAHTLGVQGTRERLSPEYTSLAEHFAAAGYATGYIGKWHLDGEYPAEVPGGFIPAGPRRQGWQEWNGYQKGQEYFEVWRYDEHGQKQRVPGYDWEPTWQTDMMLDFAGRKRAEGKPWLFFLSYGPPHEPAQCPQRFLDLFDPRALAPRPDQPTEGHHKQARRSIWHTYYAQVAAVDHEVGRAMAGLDELGQRDDTVVIYLSDHGDRLGSHLGPDPREGRTKSRTYRGKGEPFATAFRVPLIVRPTGRVTGSGVCNTLVSSVDLAPTILGLAGLPPVPAMHGWDLSSWVTRGTGRRRDELYLGTSVWRATWDGHLLYSPEPYSILYDHDADPYELRNLFDDPSAVERREAARVTLERLVVQVGANSAGANSAGERLLE